MSANITSSDTHLGAAQGATEAHRESYSWYGERVLEGATPGCPKSRIEADGFAGTFDTAVRIRG